MYILWGINNWWCASELKELQNSLPENTVLADRQTNRKTSVNERFSFNLTEELHWLKKFMNISIFLNRSKTSLLPVEIGINIYNQIKWEQWYFYFIKVGVYIWTSVLSKKKKKKVVKSIFNGFVLLSFLPPLSCLMKRIYFQLVLLLTIPFRTTFSARGYCRWWSKCRRIRIMLVLVHVCLYSDMLNVWFQHQYN